MGRTNVTTEDHGRLRVLVLFGGRSSEHPISCITATGVLGAMDPERYEAVPVGITRTGQWHGLDADPANWNLPGGDLPRVPEPADPLTLHLTSDGTHELVSVTRGTSYGAVDVVFPLLHGPFGEDGTLQGELEMAAVPYVGAGVLASAVGMDKHFMKLAFQAAGLSVGPWETVTDRQWRADPEAAVRRVAALGAPLFVKPARAGSSFGITRVSDPEGIVAAIEEARRFDPKVVVEAGIEGREIECAVLDGHGVSAPRASLPGEIVVRDGSGGHDFYDFQAKYQDDSAAELSCPADLPQEAIELVQRLAVEAFDAVDAEGLSRVDFFYTPDGTFVINEINTMPGFTPISMYPSMWERSGLPYGELIDELLSLALERGTGLH
ncbi:D-alanine--D-alanine ligase family protein [Citricoccus sp. I39-566]|uniref:D-alanine--D-alanine ligase family protein n=1 Tax=Citricoccus sp. I39-566 TaxID=3073268 RepID=UPI00286B13F1|nr:D-alanine--D-alanine ligase family protein [Citricoccus sp. I39-566]WMY79855.1 D-alanine--D-alanine ligase family protein [Citricoccus sp. I39-566]